MNNEIQKFDFKGAALRTLTDEAGEPWFVLKDCMSILDLGNPTETVPVPSRRQGLPTDLANQQFRLINGFIQKRHRIREIVQSLRKLTLRVIRRRIGGVVEMRLRGINPACRITHNSSPNCSARTSEMRDDTDFRRGPGGSPNAARHYTRKGGA